MKDELLVVGKPSKKTRAIILIIGLSIFCLGFLLFLGNYGNCRIYVSRWVGVYTVDIFKFMFLMDSADNTLGSFLVLVFLDLGLLLSIIGLIVYLSLNKVSITVTPKRVTGTTTFGRRVDLPVDDISAIGTGALKAIVVSTSSGKIKFRGLENRDELYGAITYLLMERQNRPEPASPVKQEPQKNNVDELKKYKELLDSDIITQEEFDAKKKQLLGL